MNVRTTCGLQSGSYMSKYRHEFKAENVIEALKNVKKVNPLNKIIIFKLVLVQRVCYVST